MSDFCPKIDKSWDNAQGHDLEKKEEDEGTVRKCGL